MSKESLDDVEALPTPVRKDIADDDRVLLKLVAYALGARRFEEVDGEGYANLHFADGSVIYSWNPLLFSHDAFDMMVGLDVYVFQSLDARETQAAGPGQRVVYQAWGEDKLAATRRAATKAAAAIGKQRSS